MNNEYVDLYKYIETYSSEDEVYSYIKSILIEFGDDCSIDTVAMELHCNFELPCFTFDSLSKAVDEVLEGCGDE